MEENARTNEERWKGLELDGRAKKELSNGGIKRSISRELNSLYSTEDRREEE
jgi:hypothetical protein